MSSFLFYELCSLHQKSLFFIIRQNSVYLGVMARYKNTRSIVGRLEEQLLLDEAQTSPRSELIVVYGRRRIGKTFLIREFYKKNIFFEFTGLHNGKLKDQLFNFNTALNRTLKAKDKEEVAESWMEAFSQLEKRINAKAVSKQKKVIFIDEFPWIATARSKFLMSFENFWNSFASKRDDLIVVICGSAASYMVQKIIRNKGGLHNRITRKIRLLPFTLLETKQYLESHRIHYTLYDIVQLYMAIGGVPHYLDQIKRGQSVAQNIDRLCFSKDGLLKNEFVELFQSLFDYSKKHIAIIEALAAIRKGITRTELMKRSKIKSGGDLSLKLEELIESGFVSEYNYYKNKKQLSLYRLSDEYCLFYLKFIKGGKNQGAGTWKKYYNSRSYSSWSGFSFETLCLKHQEQIRKALGLEAIYCSFSSWFNKNAQIDLLIQRDDRVINICEIKFSKEEFTITKSYHQSLQKKRNEFVRESQTKNNVYLTMITTYGIHENKYSLELIENELTLESLFGL